MLQTRRERGPTQGTCQVEVSHNRYVMRVLAQDPETDQKKLHGNAEKRRTKHLERHHSGITTPSRCVPINHHTPTEAHSDVLRASWRCPVAECPWSLAAEDTEGRRRHIMESAKLKRRVDTHPDLNGEEFRRLATMEPRPEANYCGAMDKALHSKISTVSNSRQVGKHHVTPVKKPRRHTVRFLI